MMRWVAVIVALVVGCGHTSEEEDQLSAVDITGDVAVCVWPKCGDEEDCKEAFIPPGEACGVGPCQSQMLCTQGECVPETDPCDDDNPCTEDRCTEEDECRHDPFTGGELRCGVGECEKVVAQCVAGTLQSCVPGDPVPEVCDGKDNDCNGEVDDGIPMQSCGEGICQTTTSGCEDGVVPDCTPDPSAAVAETCNGKDDDCNGVVDDPGASGCQPYLLDEDGDGYSSSATVYSCLCTPQPPYTALVAGDCDDTDADVHPEATEVCNGVDDDCDQQTDEAGTPDCRLFFVDADEDGYGDSTLHACLCNPDQTHTTDVGGDCDDSNAAINPAALEACGGVDENCDGQIDEEDAAGCIHYYYDGDGDGYGDINGTESHCLCKTTPDYPKFTAKNKQDCCDADARVRPSQSTYQTTISLCGGWDFNCAGGVTKQYPDSGVCDMELVTCNVFKYGFINGFIDCGAVGAYLIDCSYNWGVCDKTTEARTQGCL